MRRSLTVVAVLAATLCAPAAASASIQLTVARVDWFPLHHQLWVRTAWTPARYATNVRVLVWQASGRIRTVHALHWLIGRKTFRLVLPRSIPTGTVVTADVRVASRAGVATRRLRVTLD